MATTARIIAKLNFMTSMLPIQEVSLEKIYIKSNFANLVVFIFGDYYGTHFILT